MVLMATPESGDLVLARTLIEAVLMTAVVKTYHNAEMNTRILCITSKCSETSSDPGSPEESAEDLLSRELTIR